MKSVKETTERTLDVNRCCTDIDWISPTMGESRASLTHLAQNTKTDVRTLLRECKSVMKAYLIVSCKITNTGIAETKGADRKKESVTVLLTFAAQSRYCNKGKVRRLVSVE